MEIYNLMRALDIEESTDNLRYNHVILATDADVDGLHIRNLMITFFLRFFEPLVKRGVITSYSIHYTKLYEPTTTL